MPVGRFQVMATLQAARAHVLGLPLESAYSWGLNRAIFYAAAKRGFKGGGGEPSKGKAAGRGRPAAKKAEAETYYLGDEMAYRYDNSDPPLFMIGGKAQTREDFERQVAARFQKHFKEAWEEALDYVRHFDQETLLSGTEFFSKIYRPKRDLLAERWSTASKGRLIHPKNSPINGGRA